MTTPTPRPGVLDIEPYVGGLHSVDGVERVIVLASNETPLGPSPKAIAAYEAESRKLHRSSPGARILRRDVSRSRITPINETRSSPLARP